MKKILLTLIVCLTILSCSSSTNDGQICSKVVKIEKRYDGYDGQNYYVYYRIYFENGDDKAVESYEIHKYKVGKTACYYKPMGFDY